MLAPMSALDPALISIRAATAADAAAIARVDVETWRETYAGVLPQDLLLGLSRAERRRAWTEFIRRCPGDALVAADAREGVVGFGSCGRRRSAGDRFAGEVFTLYVDPAWQGEGLGRRLLLHVFGRLLSRRLPTALVWVLRDNPARFFYERLGGRLVATKPIRVGGAEVAAVAYGWTDLAGVLEAQSRAGR
jgi:ribosomal protein S18 acetylase RimI-like enzyme